MKPRVVLIALMFGIATVLAACAGEAGPEGPQGPAGPPGPPGPVTEAEVNPTDLSCTQCHEDTGILVSKHAQLALSGHGTGTAYLRGASASCAGCHGSEGPMARIRAGLQPHDDSITAVANPSPIQCRTCHQIHTTYTENDWTLEGSEAAVALEKTDGTFDRGAGNLCANCHQIRNDPPVAIDGMIEVESTHYGTHHGVEANMLLGVGGMFVTGSPSPHYTQIEDGCPTCHMGPDRNHTWVPNVAYCQDCHADLDTFDRNGTQTEIEALLEEAKGLLVTAGIVDPESGNSVPGSYPEAVVQAFWNYSFVEEDQSMGVHNPAYAKSLLESAISALGGGTS